jgi:hypothetical protein
MRAQAVVRWGGCWLPFGSSGFGISAGAISGLVTDNTGAVMPGVTIEATSPVLIEESRSVVTDGQGRYTIIDLRPGTYSHLQPRGLHDVKRGPFCRQTSRQRSICS